MFKRFFGGLLLLAPVFSYAQNIDYTRIRNGPMVSDGSALSFSAACTAAGTQALAITKAWTSLPSQTCGATLVFTGGSLAIASGQALTISGSVFAPPVQIFNVSASGSSVTFSHPSGVTEIYPQWFGAKQDGVTDDTKAVQAAITAGLASGIPVRLMAGTFLVNTATSSVILNYTDTTANQNGLKVFGAGAKRTVIKTTTGAADLLSAVQNTAGQPYFVFQGLTLQGPDGQVIGCTGTTTSGNGFRLSQVSPASNPRLQMQDVTVQGFCGSGKVGIWLDGPEDSQLDSVRASYNNIGLKLTNATNGTTFNNLMADQNLFGVYTQGSISNTFNSPVIQSNRKTGLDIEGGTGNNTINAPHFENNNYSATAGEYAVKMVATALLGAVQANLFNGGTYNGSHENIYLNGAASISVANNTFAGGIISSAASPFVIIDGPYVVANSFLGGIISDVSVVSLLNSANYQLMCPMTTGSATGGNGECYFPSSVSRNLLPNFINDTGANNAIVGSAHAALTNGLDVYVRLFHTLQAGANTFNYNGGGVVGIYSNAGGGGVDIAHGYVVGAIVHLYYNGNYWFDLAQ